MNSGQNHFRQSQQRINTIIVINGNKILFSPEIISAHSRLLCPVPTFPILCFLSCYSCSFSLFSLPPIVCTPPTMTSFFFSKPVHHFFPTFFSPSLNPIHPSKENPSQENVGGSDASSLCSCYCLCCNTTGMFHTEPARNKVPK